MPCGIPGITWYFCVGCTDPEPYKALRRRDVIAHQVKHTGVKPFGCGFCERRFTQKKEMMKHEEQHPTLQHKCKHCPLKFAFATERTEHTRLVHGNKPWSCRYCERKFSTGSNRRRHELVHTGQRRYKCHICQKAFARTDSRTQHLGRHFTVDYRPFKCKMCSRGFRYRTNVNQHRVICGQPARQHACAKCPSKFFFKRGLQDHCRVAHPPRPSIHLIDSIRLIAPNPTRSDGPIDPVEDGESCSIVKAYVGLGLHLFGHC